MGSRAGGQWLVGWEDGLVGGLCRREFQGLAIRVAQRFVLVLGVVLLVGSTVVDMLTANLFPDKPTAHGILVWMVNLDLSKAFDRVHWPTLWIALHAQGILDHMIWMLSKLYEGQSGEVRGK